MVKPGVLQSMGSQRVGHDWVTELNWRSIRWDVGSNHLSGWWWEVLMADGTHSSWHKVASQVLKVSLVVNWKAVTVEGTVNLGMNEWMNAHSLAAPQTPSQCLVHLQTYITSSPLGHSHGRCLLPLSATLSMDKYQYLGGFYSEVENFMDGNAKELSINIISLRMREKLHLCKVKGTIRRIIKLQNSRKWKSLTRVRLFATPWTT